MAAADAPPDFRRRIARVLAAFGRHPSDAATALAVERGARFAELVVAWNARVDLTAARDPDELVDLLFADAAAILGAGARPAGECWVDVGSGLGAPGVALALLDPRLDVTLVEPRAKRIAFLRTLLHHLERPDVHVERKRSEALADGSSDVAISRATLPPPEWLVEGARLARQEVWVLLARDAAPSFEGWSVERALEFQWPLTERSRRALCYRPSTYVAGEEISGSNER